MSEAASMNEFDRIAKMNWERVQRAHGTRVRFVDAPYSDEIDTLMCCLRVTDQTITERDAFEALRRLHVLGEIE